jgi:hypothetical protein
MPEVLKAERPIRHGRGEAWIGRKRLIVTFDRLFQTSFKAQEISESVMCDRIAGIYSECRAEALVRPRELPLLRIDRGEGHQGCRIPSVERERLLERAPRAVQILRREPSAALV